jgi:hypothetical protein
MQAGLGQEAGGRTRSSNVIFSEKMRLISKAKKYTARSRTGRSTVSSNKLSIHWMCHLHYQGTVHWLTHLIVSIRRRRRRRLLRRLESSQQFIDSYDPNRISWLLQLHMSQCDTQPRRRTILRLFSHVFLSSSHYRFSSLLFTLLNISYWDWYGEVLAYRLFSTHIDFQFRSRLIMTTYRLHLVHSIQSHTWFLIDQITTMRDVLIRAISDRMRQSTVRLQGCRRSESGLENHLFWDLNG